MTDSKNDRSKRRLYRSIWNNENIRNPFRIKTMDDYHRNFPSFDSVFAAPQDTEQPQQEEDTTSALDLSIVSTSILSISGKAAMNAHNRRVALHGIDGEYDQPSASSTGVTPFDDAAWEALNLSINVDSFSSDSTSNDSSDRILVSSAPDGSEEVEVTTADDSSSIVVDEMFFQSDRVEALRTPERYKSLPCSGSPTKRQTDEASSDVQNLSTTSSAQESDTKALVRLAMSACHANTSSSSSSSTFSGGSHNDSNKKWIREAPIFDISSPWSNNSSSQNHHYSLPPSLSEQASGDGSTINGSFLLNQSAISYCSSSSDHHSGSISSAQRTFLRPHFHDSPIDKPMLSPRRTSAEENAFDDTLFTVPLNSSRTDPLSPPRTKFLGTFPPTIDSDVLSPIRRADASSSDESSKRSHTTSFHRDNPRFYRTVVPSRVFMEDDGGEYPLEQDSFSPREAPRDED